MNLLDLLNSGVTETTRSVGVRDQAKKAALLEALQAESEQDDRLRRNSLDDLNRRNIESQIRDRDTRIDPNSPEGIKAAGERAKAVQGARPIPAPRPVVSRPSGTPAAPPAISEGERKTGALLQTAMEGYSTLEPLLESNATPPTLGQRAAANLGRGVGNVLSSDQLRQVDQAGYSIAEAWLRLTSGGAITPVEVEQVKNAILPQPGDDATTLAQKKRLRETYIRAIRTAAGRGADAATQNAPSNPVTTSTGRTFERAP